MHEITRRAALVTLALSGLGTLSPPSTRSWLNYQRPLPDHFPQGWEPLRGYLLASVKPGPFLRSKPTHSAVYLGNGAALTAAHAAPPEGAYDVRPVRFSFTGGNETADLLLYRMKNTPNLPVVPLAEQLPQPGSPLVHGGMGHHRSPSTRVAPGSFMYVCTPEESMQNGPLYHSPLFRLESTPFAKDGEPERVAVGDSGGPVFAFNYQQGVWELAGILVSSMRDGFVISDGRVLHIAQAVDLTHWEIRQQLVSYVEGR
jgi:hypothetical protein